MKIYTRTGDDGTTSLSGGRRISKHHARIEAYGTVDELISWIGLLRSDTDSAGRVSVMTRIQSDLMTSAAALAHDPLNKTGRQVLPEKDCIEFLEKEIDLMESKLPALNSFILPGGDRYSSYCHIARCVCRRAERSVLRLNEKEVTPEIVKKYLNRLSDFLFVLGRLASYESGKQDVKWKI